MDLPVLSDMIETLKFHGNLITNSLESIDSEFLKVSPINELCMTFVNDLSCSNIKTERNLKNQLKI